MDSVMQEHVKIAIVMKSVCNIIKLKLSKKWELIKKYLQQEDHTGAVHRFVVPICRGFVRRREMHFLLM